MQFFSVVGPDPEPKKKRAAVSEEPSSPVALPTAYPEYVFLPLVFSLRQILIFPDQKVPF